MPSFDDDNDYGDTKGSGGGGALHIARLKPRLAPRVGSSTTPTPSNLSKGYKFTSRVQLHTAMMRSKQNQQLPAPPETTVAVPRTAFRGWYPGVAKPSSSFYAYWTDGGTNGILA